MKNCQSIEISKALLEGRTLKDVGFPDEWEPIPNMDGWKQKKGNLIITREMIEKKDYIKIANKRLAQRSLLKI